MPPLLEQLEPRLLSLAAILSVYIMYRRGLIRQYRALSVYIVVEALGDLLVSLLPVGKREYFAAWSVISAAFLLLQVWISSELARILLTQFKNIADYIHQRFRLFLFIAAAGSVALVYLAGQALAGGDFSLTAYRTHWALGYARLLIICIDSAVILFLLLAGAYFLYFPVRISRNFVIYYITFLFWALVYLGSQIVTGSVLDPTLLSATNHLLFFVTLAGYLVLMFALRPAEQDELVQPRNPDPPTAQRLLAQLDQINGLLGSAGDVN